MRTLFIGGTKRGYQTLRALIEHGANIAGILSLRQDEHERERYEAHMRALAAEHQIPLRETKFLKKADFARWVVHDIRPDLAIVVGCRIMLPKSIWGAPPRGTLAVHDSLLPAYRGFAPLNWSIINGENHTGVTLFHINESMDAGDIVAQRKVPIGPGDTAPEVYERVCAATVGMVIDAYPRLADGSARAIPQDESTATFTCSRTPLDGLIDWHADTQSISCKVRALTNPYPGAFTYLDGRRLTIWRAEPLSGAPGYVGRIPGRVVGVHAAQGHVDVLTRDGVLRIFEVELAGGGTTSAAAVITSVKATLGLRTSDLLARIEVLEAQLAAMQAATDLRIDAAENLTVPGAPSVGGPAASVA